MNAQPNPPTTKPLDKAPRVSERTVVLRLSVFWLGAVLVLVLGPWALVGWIDSRYDPDMREELLAGKVALLDSLHRLDSLTIVRQALEVELWRARFGEACQLRPVQDLESCRLLVDGRLAARAKRQARYGGATR